MSPWPIDLDTESIQYDGNWYTREELAQRIKAMLDSGDFAVGRPSQALEQLTLTLANLRTIAFKITPDMAEAVQQAAARQGRTVGGLIREAISDYMGFAEMPAREPAQAAAPAPRPPPQERTGKKPTDPELPAVVITQPGSVAPDLNATQQMVIPPQVIAGPGALKSASPPSVVVGSFVTEAASADEAEGAVSLSSPKKKDEEQPERGWFGR